MSTKNWSETTLGEVANWSSGGTPSRRNPSYYNGDIPWIKTGELGSKFVTAAAEHITEEGLKNSSAKLFPKGSVAIAMYGATIGKTSIFGLEASTNQACAVASTDPEVLDKEFLYYFLVSQRREFENAGAGGAQPNISQTVIKNWPISLPSPKLQTQIVQKIETLFAELDQGIASLKTAQAQLKLYRQSVLKQAFEGKLTEQWRQQNPELVGNASDLLQQILTERQQRYESQLADWKQAVAEWEAAGKEGKKPAKPKKIAVIKSSNELKELPPEWAISAVGNLNVAISDGPFGSHLKSSDYVETGVQVIRLENIGWLEFKGQKKSFVTEEKYQTISKHTVSAGDIIFSSFIAEGTRVTRLPVEIDRAINKADCFCVRVHGKALISDYLCLWLASRKTYEQLENEVHGATRPRVNTTQLKHVVLPLCSPSEQTQIIREIDTRFTEIDQFEQTVASSLQKAEALRQSILTKAFSGELVSSDPTDEPASELLARIKASRPKDAGAGKAKRLKKRVKQTMKTLLQSLTDHQEWRPASAVFRECGIADGAGTDEVEKIYGELRQMLADNVVKLERQGDEDWLLLSTHTG